MYFLHSDVVATHIYLINICTAAKLWFLYHIS